MPRQNHFAPDAPVRRMNKEAREFRLAEEHLENNTEHPREGVPLESPAATFLTEVEMHPRDGGVGYGMYGGLKEEKLARLREHNEVLQLYNEYSQLSNEERAGFLQSLQLLENYLADEPDPSGNLVETDALSPTIQKLVETWKDDYTDKEQRGKITAAKKQRLLQEVKFFINQIVGQRAPGKENLETSDLVSVIQLTKNGIIDYDRANALIDGITQDEKIRYLARQLCADYGSADQVIADNLRRQLDAVRYGGNYDEANLGRIQEQAEKDHQEDYKATLARLKTEKLDALKGKMEVYKGYVQSIRANDAQIHLYQRVESVLTKAKTNYTERLAAFFNELTRSPLTADEKSEIKHPLLKTNPSLDEIDQGIEKALGILTELAEQAEQRKYGFLALNKKQKIADFQEAVAAIKERLETFYVKPKLKKLLGEETKKVGLDIDDVLRTDPEKEIDKLREQNQDLKTKSEEWYRENSDVDMQIRRMQEIEGYIKDGKAKESQYFRWVMDKNSEGKMEPRLLSETETRLLNHTKENATVLAAALAYYAGGSTEFSIEPGGIKIDGRSYVTTFEDIMNEKIIPKELLDDYFTVLRRRMGSLSEKDLRGTIGRGLSHYFSDLQGVDNSFVKNALVKSLREQLRQQLFARGKNPVNGDYSIKVKIQGKGSTGEAVEIASNPLEAL